MFQFEYLKQLLLISVALSTITCTIIQKTKRLLKKSIYIVYYSFFINMIVGILFCMTFTSISLPNSLWIGLFSFLGADSIYKSLEGKLSSYTELMEEKKIYIKEENIINKEGK